MMERWFIGLFLLLMTGSSYAPDIPIEYPSAVSSPMGKIKSKEMKKDFTRKNIIITIIFHPNKKQLRDAFEEHLGKDGIKKLGLSPGKYDLLGWSVWYTLPNDKGEHVCTVHLIEPKSAQDRRQMETWGHELMHCTYGQFHE